MVVAIIHKLPQLMLEFLLIQCCNFYTLVSLSTSSKQMYILLNTLLTWRIQTLQPKLYRMHYHKCPSVLLLHFLCFHKDKNTLCGEPWIVFVGDPNHPFDRVRHRTMYPNEIAKGDAVGDIYSSLRVKKNSFRAYRHVVSYYPISLFMKKK